MRLRDCKPGTRVTLNAMMPAARRNGTIEEIEPFRIGGFRGGNRRKHYARVKWDDGRIDFHAPEVLIEEEKR